ncbi:MAG TPA: GNAT family N-acetyltransferase [Candidatus Saccharimonadales bacterium]|nr:GNAT family N-acetyltransferase [Candidatus Saccharimonadales bacterium]
MFRLELLSRAHDRDGFDCGSEPLNKYLQQTARQHTDRGISRTFVLVQESATEPKDVAGYFTLNICQLRAGQLPAEVARRLPREVAGVKLGRLAVAKGQQGKGIGKLLMVAALKKFVEVFDSAGGIGLFVDAKDSQIQSYYERFGFVPLPDDPLLLFLPLQTIKEALMHASAGFHGQPP